MKIKKVFVLTIILSLIFLTFMQGNATTSTIENLENELEETESKIDDINRRINEAQGEKKSIENEITKLDLEMEKIELEIDSLNIKIQEINLNIENKQTELGLLNEDIAYRNELLEDRLRVMYKKGFVGYMEVLLNSSDIADLVTRLDMIQKIVDCDVELIGNIKDQKERVKLLQLELESEKSNLLASKEDVENKKNEVLIVSRAKESYMLSLKSNIRELEQQEEKLLADSKKLESEIQKAQLAMEYAGGVMTWPAPGIYRVTSPYGMRIHPVYGYWKMHTGVDIGVPYGSNIVATNSGVVQYSGWYGAYGNIVIIDHGGGISTLYAHNSKLVVSTGQKVKKGDLVAISGSTGLSTGPHLHFEVRENGVHTDPMKYLK